MKRLGGLALAPRPRIASVMIVASTCSGGHGEYIRLRRRGALFLERLFDRVVQGVPEFVRVEVAAVAEDDRGPVRDQVTVVAGAEAAPRAVVAVAVHAAHLAGVEHPAEAVLVIFAVAGLGRREGEFH